MTPDDSDQRDDDPITDTMKTADSDQDPDLDDHFEIADDHYQRADDQITDATDDGL